MTEARRITSAVYGKRSRPAALNAIRKGSCGVRRDALPTHGELVSNRRIADLLRKLYFAWGFLPGRSYTTLDGAVPSNASKSALDETAPVSVSLMKRTLLRFY